MGKIETNYRCQQPISDAVDLQFLKYKMQNFCLFFTWTHHTWQDMPDLSS